MLDIPSEFYKCAGGGSVAKEDPVFWSARIVSLATDHAECRLKDSGTLVIAKVSIGILLQPMRGDTVILLKQEKTVWIVQVLERASSAPAVLAVKGARGLIIQAPEVSLKTRRFSVSAQSTRLVLGSVVLSAQVVKAVAQRLAIWADLVQTQALALVTRADQRVTQIDGTDSTRAGQLVIESDQLTRIEGAQIQVKALESVSVDGKRILMG